MRFGVAVISMKEIYKSSRHRCIGPQIYNKHFKSYAYIFMKTGCLTKSFLKIDAGGGGSYVHSRGAAKCIWYNDKKLWSGGYNISGSKLNLWINRCSLLAAGKRAYSSQNTTFYLGLVLLC